MNKVEILILKNLLLDEQYVRKTLPFIKAEYFADFLQQRLYEVISKYFTEYNAMPTKEALEIEVESLEGISDDQHSSVVQVIRSLDNEKSDSDWILDTTEKWCKERAIYLALMESIKIAEGNDDKKAPSSIPTILSDALAVSFDNNIGHDYLQDYEERYNFYHTTEEKIPFDLEFFNKITKGGLPNKTLNIALAGTGVGKSLFMCHVASGALLQNKNVLYVTLEMAEERIAERIDENLLNLDNESLNQLPKMMYETKVQKLAAKTQGKLIIKEYPTASAHAGHFRALLNELALKKDFRPDIIFIDYLNICASSRYRAGGNVNSYSYIKSIAEELRGLAVEANVPIVSATQTTRSGFASSDVDLTDTSESFGLPATADLMFALISTEELEQMNQIMVKQLKNRYNDPTVNKRFVVGLDRSKMRLYDVEQSAQDSLTDSGQDADIDSVKEDLSKKFAQLKV
jgi:archaellum biogenesis ATPase FlaH|tara:strand:- start:282 stop:1658 length:1377 start_codon:yes stop_codon:yes gene_type:complete